LTGWVTSAALAALLVATIVFYWQRTIEHGFQLRKEKRELFRELSATMGDIGPRIDDDQFLASSGLQEFTKQIYELDILGCRELSDRASKFRKLLVDSHAEVCGPKAPSEKRRVELLKTVGSEHARIVAAMQVDLQFTPVHFWQVNRLKRKLVEVDTFFDAAPKNSSERSPE